MPCDISRLATAQAPQAHASIAAWRDAPCTQACAGRGTARHTFCYLRAKKKTGCELHSAVPGKPTRKQPLRHAGCPCPPAYPAGVGHVALFAPNQPILTPLDTPIDNPSEYYYQATRRACHDHAHAQHCQGQKQPTTSKQTPPYLSAPGSNKRTHPQTRTHTHHDMNSPASIQASCGQLLPGAVVADFTNHAGALLDAAALGASQHFSTPFPPPVRRRRRIIC